MINLCVLFEHRKLDATLHSLVFKSKVGSRKLMVSIQMQNVFLDELGKALH